MLRDFSSVEVIRCFFDSAGSSPLELTAEIAPFRVNLLFYMINALGVFRLCLPRRHVGPRRSRATLVIS